MITITAFSDYLENALLDGTLRATTYTAPANVYVGLHTSATLDNNTGTEVSGNGYTRMGATFSPPVAGSTSNSSTITFPTATGTWNQVTHFGIYDTVSGGQLLYWGALTTAKTVDNGDVFTFPASNLSVTLS